MSLSKAIIGCFIFYSLVIFIANWPIIIGTDFMKWDIWDAYYPLQVITSDVIKSGSIPVWTPLMNFGTPYYAMVGIPVWYPSTLILDVIGFTPTSVATDYCVHILMGSIGMFLLVIDPSSMTDKNNIDSTKYVVALCAGLLYGFSGVFLSNAEHIMIIISAAWMPYSLYYSKKFVEKQRLVDVMTCAFFTSLIFLGGYPEIFYNLFLILIPWMIYWKLSKMDRCGIKCTIRMICHASIQFLVLIFMTIACSAITLVPFIRIISKITRGEGQDISSPPLIDLLSMLLPVGIDKISGFEISMGMFYIGFLTVLAFPLAIKKIRKERNSIFYFIMFGVTLYTCLGEKSLIHTLLYKFAPMYSTFRFPSLSRIFCCIFAILFVKDVWMDFIKGTTDRKAIKVVIVSLLSIGILFILVINKTEHQQPEIDYKSVISSIIVLVVFCIIYLVVYKLDNRYQWHNNTRGMVLIALALAEVIVVHAEAFPVTIAKYDFFEYFTDENAAKDVNSEKEEYKNRNKDCDFSNSKRSNSKLNSRYIANNKTFDEEGYLSIKLNKTDSYKNTYNRSIIQQQPEIFFSNDVVSEDDVKLSQWLELPNTSPEEIHVGTNSSQIKYDKSNEYIEPKVIDESVFEIIRIKEGIKAVGSIVADSEKATKIRLYLKDINESNILLNIQFEDDADNISNYEYNYPIRSSNGKEFVDVSLPSCDVNYTSVEVRGANLPTSISLVQLERQTTDPYINVKKFGCNKIEMSVDAPSNGIVTVLQSNFDGWNVLVDGKKTVITEVDGCFIGVPVTEGNHEIQLVFRPTDFVVGTVISLLYLISFVAVLIITKRENMKEKSLTNIQTMGRGE